MIVKALILFLLFISSMTLQSMFFPLVLGLPSPNFICIFVIFIALKFDSAPGLFFAFLLGLVGDLISGVYVGPQAGAALIAAAMTHSFTGNIYAQRGLSIFFLALVIAAIHEMVTCLILAFLANRSFVGFFGDQGLMSMGLLKVIFTAFLAPIVVRILNRVISHGIKHQ